MNDQTEFPALVDTPRGQTRKASPGPKSNTKVFPRADQPLLIYEKDRTLSLSAAVVAVAAALGKSSEESVETAQATMRAVTQTASALKERTAGGREPVTLPTGAELLSLPHLNPSPDGRP